MHSVILCRCSARAWLGVRGVLSVGAVTAAVALAVPTFASAVATQRPLPSGFVPYKSVGAVRLDMNEKAVRARLVNRAAQNADDLHRGYGEAAGRCAGQRDPEDQQRHPILTSIEAPS